jgi:hypothetical protein
MQCPLIKTRIFNFNENIKNYRNKILSRSKVELVLSFGSQFSEFIFIFSGSEF